MQNVALAYIFVAIGGAVGAMARYALNVLLQSTHDFPWGTLSANLFGCLAMGIIAQLVAQSTWFNESGLIPDQYRLLFAVGFCGSFTTLSALVLEMNTLIVRDEIVAAFGYLMATMAGGFACFYAGIVASRALMRALS